MMLASRQDAARPSPGADESATSPAFMARVMCGMFLVTGILGCSVFLFPRPPEAFDEGFVAAGAASLICALIARLVDAERHPQVLTALAAVGVALISVGIWSSPEGRGGPASDIELLYLWPALFSAYFLTWRGRVAADRLDRRLLPDGADPRCALRHGAHPLAADHDHPRRGRVPGLRASRHAWPVSWSGCRRLPAPTPSRVFRTAAGSRRMIEKEIHRARRSDGHMAVVVGDLDNFKRLNDRYGHGAGDAALKRVGQVLSAGKREIDTVARTGGEEFALLLPETETPRRLRAGRAPASGDRHAVRRASPSSRSHSASRASPTMRCRRRSCSQPPTARSTRQSSSAATGRSSSAISSGPCWPLPTVRMPRRAPRT